MTKLVTIAACQFAVHEISNFGEFANHISNLLDESKKADLVVFPELFTTELFTSFPDWQKAPISELTWISEYTDQYRALFLKEAQERGQFILAGSHLVKENGSFFNMAHLFEPGGIMHTHSKTHIFPAEADWHTKEGDVMEAISLPFSKIGINICYEAEVPECASTLAEQGAEIVICPSFTFTEHGFWRVCHCAHARAIENQIYYVHCCTTGQPGTPLSNGWGRSSILSPCDLPWRPDGVVVQAEINREMVITGKVDIDELFKNREKGAAPTYRDRRRRSNLYVKWPSHIKVF